MDSQLLLSFSSGEGSREGKTMVCRGGSADSLLGLSVIASDLGAFLCLLMLVLWPLLFLSFSLLLFYLHSEPLGVHFGALGRPSWPQVGSKMALATQFCQKVDFQKNQGIHNVFSRFLLP